MNKTRMTIFRLPLRGVVALMLLILSSRVATATETPATLAQKLQSKVLSGQGVSMKFTVPGEGKIALTVDLASRRIRLESPSVLIISNGKTVWNYQKKSKQVTIDNVSGTNSPFANPALVFQFRDHYLTKVLSNKGNQYTIEMLPDQTIRPLLKSAGDMQSLQLTLTTKGSGVTINRAVASSARGTANISSLAISPIKTIKPADFTFTPTTAMKVVDLRE